MVGIEMRYIASTRVPAIGSDPVQALRSMRAQVEESQGYVRGWADEHGGILPQPRIELGF